MPCADWGGLLYHQLDSLLQSIWKSLHISSLSWFSKKTPRQAARCEEYRRGKCTKRWLAAVGGVNNQSGWGECVDKPLDRAPSSLTPTTAWVETSHLYNCNNDNYTDNDNDNSNNKLRRVHAPWQQLETSHLALQQQQQQLQQGRQGRKLQPKQKCGKKLWNVHPHWACNSSHICNYNSTESNDWKDDDKKNCKRPTQHKWWERGYSSPTPLQQHWHHQLRWHQQLQGRHQCIVWPT